ncbi:hypothetical protein [Shewanella sp. YLB-07]|uniref:hypothetical protein n=1 Tax=Shewanella sp. YLB-07 TaxID=2601268 RepID=UPI00128CAEC2|nr:hypothetical protein [Shewanella sp. YLB-07]MPY23919.1 hypothetical protein [Shewanella sp. YLB-07]
MDYLNFDFNKALGSPSNKTMPAKPAVNNSAMNGGFWESTQDLVSGGLKTWLAVEQVNAAKDASSAGQKELQTTVQTPSGNPTMAIMTSAQSGLKGMGSSTVMAIGAALVVGLLLLTRK